MHTLAHVNIHTHTPTHPLTDTPNTNTHTCSPDEEQSAEDDTCDTTLGANLNLNGPLERVYS